MNASAPVHATHTTLLSTTVHAVGAGYRWVHQLGGAAELPFSDMTLALPQDAEPGLVTPGHGTTTRREYQTTVAGTVLGLLGTLGTGQLTRFAAQWGTALNLVHRSGAQSAVQPRPAPRTLLRAGRWLEGRWEPAHRLLGTHGLDQLSGWAWAMARDPQRVPVHGHPGMAHFIADPAGERPTLLAGEDTGAAHWFYDYGWILGELAELRAFYAPWRGRLDAMADALLARCPEPVDPAHRHLARAFRLAQHACDWHHHGGASPQQAELLLQLAAAYLTLSHSNPCQEHP